MQVIAAAYCFSYSPLLTRFNTVKPAFFASETERFFGELKADHTLPNWFLASGTTGQRGSREGAE